LAKPNFWITDFRRLSQLRYLGVSAKMKFTRQWCQFQGQQSTITRNLPIKSGYPTDLMPFGISTVVEMFLDTCAKSCQNYSASDIVLSNIANEIRRTATSGTPILNWNSLLPDINLANLLY
jgi:hypothetical protein